MATLTYDLIATTTLASGASTVSLSGIPGTFTDIRVVAEVQADTTTNRTYLSLNGVTYGQTYSWNSFLGAYSNTPAGATFTDIDYLQMQSTTTRLSSNYPNVFIIDIMQYARTDIYKSLLIDYSTNSDGNQYDIKQIICGLWKSTAAVTSVDFSNTASNFKVGSRFSVYGIKAE